MKEKIAKCLWDGLKSECRKCDWEVANEFERKTFYDWADQILDLEVGDRKNDLTIRELIKVALEAQEPRKAIILRARRRPPMIITDE